MLPKDCKHLQHDEWGVELADYFDCVAGQMLLVSPVAIELARVMNSCQSINKGVSWCCALLSGSAMLTATLTMRYTTIHMVRLISKIEVYVTYAGTSAGSMLALYIASKGGAVYQTMQDSLPKDKWLQGPLLQGSTAVAWRTVRALADSVFTPPWRFFLRWAVQTQW